ncbi:MAG TPA: hypothetical protein DDW52_20875 [Planctomycetaceae bacterium]|nr:hypothetical protein [Planctomycetaceae bacterium]
MRSLFFYALALPAVLACSIGSAQDDKSTDADQTAILAAVQSYQKAFNAKDAAAVAKHFSEDAELTTASGTIKGRAAILADFQSLFSESTATLQLASVEVDVIAPSVAIETGLAVLTKGEELQEVPYRAVHIKTKSGWRLDRVQDSPARIEPPSNYEKLKELEWLVGNWVLDTEDSSTSISCRWTTNKNFLMQTYSVQTEAGTQLEGTQIIGWDASRNVIRCWLFDSDGGFGSGAWTKSGTTWKAQTLQVVPSGEQASSTNMYELIDDSTFEFSSIGRQVGGKLMKNISAAEFVRQ